jgi:periplasmic protein TonB
MNAAVIVADYDCARRDERAGLLIGLGASCSVHGIALAALLALESAPPASPPPAVDAARPIVAVLSQPTELAPDVPPRRETTAAHPAPKAPLAALARKRIAPAAEVTDTRGFVAQEPAIDGAAAESEHTGPTSPGVGLSTTETAAGESPADSDPASPPSFRANYLDNPAPAYPSASRRLREQGRVLLLVDVAADGLPLQVNLATSSGSRRLDEAALDAVRRWRFVPARKGTNPVAAQVLVPIVFGLSD